MTIIIVYNHSSHPSPAEVYGQSCHGPGLVNITGDCSEDVRKLKPVTKTGAACKVADLRERSYKYYFDTAFTATTPFYF